MKLNKKIIFLTILLSILLPLAILSGCSSSSKLKVMFHDGNRLYATSVIEDDYSVALPDNPTKNGYTFVGWYLDKDSFEQEFDPNSLGEETTASISVFAKYETAQYTITYHTNGGNLPSTYTQTYNIKTETFSLPVPTKTHYSFVSWYTDANLTTSIQSVRKGSYGNLDLYAKYLGEEHTITYVLSGGSNSNSNPTTFNYDSGNIPLYPATKNYYTFVKWYYNSAPDTAVEQINTETLSDITIYADFDPIEYVITTLRGNNTYPNGISPNYSMPNLTYNIEQSLDLPNASMNYYDFVGWYLEPNFNTPISNIPVGSHGAKTIYAKFTPKSYTITYNLDDGQLSGTNPTTYTVLNTFTLNNPTKTVGDDTYEFYGWDGTGLDEITNTVTIAIGSHGNREYTAHYYDELFTLNLYIEGDFITSTNFFGGQTVNLSNLYNADDLGMTGYSVNNWYSNQALSTPFDTNTKLYETTSVYGSWDYMFDYISFYPYLSKFNTAVSSEALTVTSRQELEAYIDYVRFYNIATQVKIYFTYGNFSNQSNIMSEIQDACSSVTSGTFFQTSSAIGAISNYNYTNSKFYGSVYISKDTWPDQAQLVFDEDKEYVYEQQDYAFKMVYPMTRTVGYNDFKINNVSKTISNISTTEQLVWALENGYNVSFKAGSVAETMYTKAKQVLVQIIDDTMSDLDKARAIYEWLIMNVQYDNYALAASQESNRPEGMSSSDFATLLKTHDSWFVEGVLNHYKAVCEGIAKTLLVLAKVENIPTIYVTGNGHAWNKIYIGHIWYGIDATHGGIALNNQYEILSYDSFLFTDAYKTGEGYSTTDFANIKAQTVFDFYTYYTFRYNLTDYDLLIESSVELYNLMRSIKNYSPDITCDNYTVEIAFRNADDFNNWSNQISLAGVSTSGYVEISTSTNYYVYCILIVNN